MASLIERHRDQILGVLSCLDRVVIRGTLPSVCHAQAMATTLDSRGIRLFDYATEFAQPFRQSIRAHAERVAADGGIEVGRVRPGARPSFFSGDRKKKGVTPVASMLVSRQKIIERF
jgi:hypothetical protein